MAVAKSHRHSGCRRCCCRCCRCSGAALAGLVAAVAFALELQGSEPPVGFRPGSGAAALRAIPRVNASELRPQAFLEDFVLPGVPALIRLEPGGRGAASLRTLAEELLRSPCARRQLRLLSAQQEDVVQDLRSLEGWPRTAVDLGLRVLAGVDLEGWVEQRQISLQQLRAGPAAAGARRDPLAVRLVGLLTRLSGGRLHPGYLAVARLVSQPVYLSDRPVEEVCAEVLGPLAEGLVVTDYELRVQEEVEALRRAGARRNLSEVEAMGVGLQQTPELRMFWGGAGGYVYPLHRDVSDADVLCTMYSGCKDLVIVKPSARHLLERIRVPGFGYMRQFTWSHDFFADPPVPGATGWSGTMQAGELLFMPGEMFHHIRNRCAQSLTLCRRPWRASEARDVMAESLKSLNLIRETESLEEGLLDLRERLGLRDDEAEEAEGEGDWEEGEEGPGGAE